MHAQAWFVYFILMVSMTDVFHCYSFNCMIVLTALFLSSCYWQPTPIDSPLSAPWSENITTFSQAFDAMVPANITIDKPDVVQLLDRCWCDISSASFFKPFNMTKWESDSLAAFIGEAVREQQAQIATPTFEAEKESSNSSVSQMVATTNDSNPPSNSIRRALRSFFTKSLSAKANEPTLLVEPVVNDTVTMDMIKHTQTPVPKLPWYQREYNLQPYGFDVTFEWGWDGSHNK